MYFCTSFRVNEKTETETESYDNLLITQRRRKKKGDPRLNPSPGPSPLKSNRIERMREGGGARRNRKLLENKVTRLE